MKSPRTTAIITMILVSACCNAAFAQGERTTPALAGPSVSEKAERKSLVEFDFPGKVKRLDTTPEEMALRLMDLDSGLRQRIDAILNERLKQLDEFVARNLELLTKLETASASGDKLDQAMLLAEGVQKLSPVWMKGSLRSQIDELLPKAKRAELKALLDEYWDAIVKEQQAEPVVADDAPPANAMDASGDSAGTKTAVKVTGKAGALKAAGKPTSPKTVVKKKSRWEIMVAERLASFGKEIERSFQRQLQSGDIIYRYIESAVVMTAQQKGKVRELCADFAEKTKMNPTEKQNQELFVKIAGTLDTDQQIELAKLLKGLKKPAPRK